MEGYLYRSSSTEQRWLLPFFDYCIRSSSLFQKLIPAVHSPSVLVVKSFQILIGLHLSSIVTSYTAVPVHFLASLFIMNTYEYIKYSEYIIFFIAFFNFTWFLLYIILKLPLYLANYYLLFKTQIRSHLLQKGLPEMYISLKIHTSYTSIILCAPSTYGNHCNATTLTAVFSRLTSPYKQRLGPVCAWVYILAHGWYCCYQVLVHKYPCTECLPWWSHKLVFHQCQLTATGKVPRNPWNMSPCLSMWLPWS